MGSGPFNEELIKIINEIYNTGKRAFSLDDFLKEFVYYK